MLKAEGDEMTFRMGKNLQAAREALNLSPQTAALRIGVAATQVEDWETDRQQPSLAQLVLISQRLGLTPQTMLGVMVQPAPPVIGMRQQNRSMAWSATSDELRRGMLALLTQLAATLTPVQAEALMPVLNQHFVLVLEGVTSVPNITTTLGLALSKAMRQQGLRFEPAQDDIFTAIMRMTRRRV